MTPEEIQALIAELATLSDEDLAARRTQLEALVDEIVEAKATSRLTEAEAADAALASIRTEQDRRATEEAEAVAQLDEIAARRAAAAEVVEPPVEPEVVDDADPPAEPPAEPVVEAVAEPVAVAASATRPPPVPAAAIARQSPRPTPAPDASPRQTVTITASTTAQGVGISRGDEITESQVWEMIDSRAKVLIDQAGNPNAEDVYLAKVRRNAIPEERMLHPRDIAGNAEKMEALVSSAKAKTRAEIDEMARTGQLPAVGGQALTAAVAALCAPLAPIYTIVEHASDATPFLDSLPSMGADRGGYTFSRSPGLSALTSGYDNITATEAAEPVTKPIVEVDCPSFVSIQVQANVLRIRHRNWSDRFWPERTKNLNDLGMAEKARNVEETLLANLIADAGVTNNTAGDDYGAFRDFFNHLERAIVKLQHGQRLADSEPMEWHGQRSLRNTLRDDLMAGTDDPALLSQADAEIARHFAARGVRPYFHWDGPTEPVIGADNAALPDLPTSYQWGLWVPGDVVALDAGEMNVGANPIRDSTLNATNAFEMFFESFENVMVPGRLVLWVTSTLCSNGSKALAITPRACPSGS